VTLPFGWIRNDGTAKRVSWKAATIWAIPSFGLPGTRCGKQVTPTWTQGPGGVALDAFWRRNTLTLGPSPCAGVLPAHAAMAGWQKLSAFAEPGAAPGQFATEAYS
jgi:hypothetical protein